MEQEKDMVCVWGGAVSGEIHTRPGILLTLIYQWFFILTTVPQKFKAITSGKRNWLRGWNDGWTVFTCSYWAWNNPQTKSLLKRRRQVNPEYVFLLFPSSSSPSLLLGAPVVCMFGGGAAAHVCRFACKGQMLTLGLFFYFSSYVQRQGFSIESRVCQFGQGVTLLCFCLLSLMGHTSLVLKWVWVFQVHSSHLCGKPFWLSLLSIPLLLLWMCFIIQLMDQYILLV